MALIGTKRSKPELDFDLTTEQTLIQDAARRMVETKITPVIAAHDADTPLPKAVMHELIGACADIGMIGGRVPENLGGAGLRLLDLGLMYEQLPANLFFGVLAQEVTAARLSGDCTELQRERFLDDILSARRLACTGTTEPGAGSDPRGITTRAEPDGDVYRITGRKMWISNVSICDVMLLTCALGTDERGLARMVRFIVDRAETPFEAHEIPTLGVRQGHLGEAVFENLAVPAANQLGHEGDAARSLTLTWLGNRPFVGLCAVNMAQKALDMALAWAGERKQFGKAIAGHQLIQEQLADIAADVTTSRLLCYYALSRIDAGDRANQITAMAKRKAIAACEHAISAAMHVFGAMGIARETGLEQLYRDVRMLPIPDGTNQILTLIEGRELTGIPAYRS